MIQIQRLTKRFGPLLVLKNLDFYVKPGESVALVGPNGAGKTTLLRILASLARPTSGRVQVASFSLPDEGVSVRSLIGVVSHQPLLYGDLSGEENLLFFSRLYQVEKARIEQVLELVGLTRRKDDLVRTFSRGMIQRLAIGRAILHHPKLLLLDEPYTGLDQEAGEILDSLLLDVASQGRTVLMTTHDMFRATKMASRLDMISKGRVVKSVTRKNFDSENLSQLYSEILSGNEEAG